MHRALRILTPFLRAGTIRYTSDVSGSSNSHLDRLRKILVPNDQLDVPIISEIDTIEWCLEHELKTHLDFKNKEFHWDLSFEKDLGLTKLGLIGLLVRLEIGMGVLFDDDEVLLVRTLRDVLKICHARSDNTFAFT